MKRFIWLALFIVLSPPLWAQQPATQEEQAQNQNRQPPLVDEAALHDSARASKMIGFNVYRGDSVIGSISDVLVDLNRGSVTAVIVSMSGILNHKLVAVPPNMITVDKEARFTIGVTEDQLKAAPTFDPGKL